MPLFVVISGYFIADIPFKELLLKTKRACKTYFAVYAICSCVTLLAVTFMAYVKFEMGLNNEFDLFMSLEKGGLHSYMLKV